MRGAILTVALFGFSGQAAVPQQQSGAGSQLPSAKDPTAPFGPDIPPSLQQKQEKARNDDRQRRLVADTDKLLALATQLHDDVAKTDKNVMSLDVIKRADEIEKLAHAIKDRMRG